MQYENFERRIIKIADFIKLMIKHLTKVIIAASAVFAIALTLLLTRGIISAEACPTEIAYGDSLGYSASAFLSRVHYEYTEFDKNAWTTEVPTAPGVYRVRAVSKATFGYRYGVSEIFTITPRTLDVNIADSSFVYGEDPSVTASTVYGDRIECTSFIYDDDRTVVCADLDAVRIISEDGEDVTDRYALNAPEREIKTLPRVIRIESLGEEKAYDGVPLYVHDFIIASGSLAAGDTACVSFENEQLCVGSTTNVFTYSIVNADGEDVTRFYSVSTSFGILKVTRREIFVQSATGERVYNGLEYNNEAAAVVGDVALAVGEKLVTDNWASITDVGSTENTFTATVLNALGEDVSDNYKINYVYGTLTVAKRPITVVTATDEKTYFGNTWSNATLASDELGVGDEFIITSHAEIKYVGTVENRVEFTVFSNSRGKDVTDNYEITTVCGTLTVNKRPIHLITGTEEFIYNGSPNTNTTVTVSDSIGEGMIEGHFIDVEAGTFVTNVTDSADNVLSVKIYEGEKDVTENFDIAFEWGRLTVSKRPITVTTVDKEFYFDKDSHSSSELHIDNIVDGHKIVVLKSSEITYPGECENEIYEYDIVDGDGVSVKDNYNPTFINGILRVLKRPVTVMSASAEKIYDAKPLTAKEWLVSEDSICDLLPGDKIAASSLPYGTITDVGSCDNVFNSNIRIVDSNGVDITKYYDVTPIAGVLTVKPRPITVRTESASIEYDDKSHSFDGATVVTTDGGYDLCTGHKIMPIGSVPSYRFVKDSGDNVFEVAVYSGNKDISYNYEITYDYGYVEIKPREITVATNDISEIYSDTDISDATVKLVGTSGLCKGHKLVAREALVFHDVILDAENIVTAEVYLGDTPLTENYKITYQYGNVNVYPRPITIATDSFNGEYDGLEHGGKWWIVKTEYGLCTGHAVNVLSITTFRDVVDDAENKIELEIIKNGTDKVTHNYDITFDLGRVTITPRKINIITGSNSWMYDGKSHDHKFYEVVDSSFVEGHEAKISFASSIKNVGTEDNVIKLTVFDENKRSVTHNYEITIIEHGTLEITPIPDDEGGSGDGSGSGSGSGSGGGMISSSGKIESPEMSDEEMADQENQVLYYVFSSVSGQVYLKLKSFGAYNGQGWDEAREFTLRLDKTSAAYLTAMAAKNSGKPAGFIRITSLYNQYVLPYYASNESGDIQMSDVLVNGDASSEYSLYYYTLSSFDGLSVPYELYQFEREYAKFVYEQYLDIDDETLAYMKGIIEREGFSRDDPDIISKVAAYIQNAAEYSLDFDRSLNESPNIAIAFLEEYKVGICQHYATAGTLLFRALGIPARYTVGCTGATKAGDVTEITAKQAHAWVEVYIDGVGFVQVEVTGGSSDGSGGSGGSGGSEEEKKQKITVEPLYQFKVYDGKPFVAENKISELDSVLMKLLDAGYTYDVLVNGTLQSIGECKTTIESFVLYDPDGNDVTDKFEIKYKDGLMKMGGGVIKIYLYEKKYEYTGKSFYYALDEYAVLEIPAGIELVLNGINISMKNVGFISSNQINQDIEHYLSYSVYANGDYSTDLAEHYIISVVSFIDGGEYIPMEIIKRDVTLKTGDSTKEYDGKELTCNVYYISKGTLADGHTVTVEVLGKITSKGETPNTVNKESIMILDEDGNDVTYNYNVDLSLGILTVIGAG